jgi:hypothetical protein
MYTSIIVIVIIVQFMPAVNNWSVLDFWSHLNEDIIDIRTSKKVKKVKKRLHYNNYGPLVYSSGTLTGTALHLSTDVFLNPNNAAYDKVYCRARITIIKE